MLALIWSVTAGAANHQAYRCVATPEKELGPLYQEGAPARNIVGEGYLLFGTVKSATDCGEIPSARIEVWMAGPQGLYGEDWRATLFSNDKGAYYFQSHSPPDYGTGRPHIHIKVRADGFQTLTTQHYPDKDAGDALFDLILVPLPDE